MFEYDHISGRGVLRGSDVDWQSYPVVNGVAQDLVLNNEELIWLRKAWAECVGE